MTHFAQQLLGPDSCTEAECRRCRTPPQFRTPDMRHSGIGSYPKETNLILDTQERRAAGERRKESNPKDVVGIRKAPLSTLPWRVLWRIGLAMLEGALKYGRHNYRAVGVRASVYFDGTQRHLGAWWEGEDVDPDSGFSHIDKAIASLLVLRDSMLGGNWEDDRPPRASEDFAHLHAEAARIMDMHKDKSPKHYTIKDTP